MKKNYMTVLLIVAIFIFIFALFFPHQTHSTEVGVRVIKWSPIAPQGVVQEVYAPGATYFFPPIINGWHTYDTKLQNMEMTAQNDKGSRSGDDALIFKTIDGNDIALDVIIAYRIDPKKAPYILQNSGFSNEEVEERLVRPITRNVTRELFGELKTEDFYIANKRTEKAELAKQDLNQILNPYGIIVENVLPKDYRFNGAYQKAIEDKKVADQMAERFKSETKATVEEYNERVQLAQGEVNKMIADVDGEYLKAKISADAYYDQQSKIAKAIEAEGIAQAQGIKKMVEALNSSGGTTMVKMKMAEALIGKKIYLLPFGEGNGIDLKTTNVNDLLQLYGVQQASQNK
ncbi:MAG: prohibitin family protein [Candidatus Omnitrophica bacterium]|nr:prohibitin family protein [Candidatus Omnitrophota bacterium]